MQLCSSSFPMHLHLSCPVPRGVSEKMSKSLSMWMKYWTSDDVSFMDSTSFSFPLGWDDVDPGQMLTVKCLLLPLASASFCLLGQPALLSFGGDCNLWTYFLTAIASSQGTTQTCGPTASWPWKGQYLLPLDMITMPDNRHPEVDFQPKEWRHPC